MVISSEKMVMSAALTAALIKNLIKEKLGVENVEIECAHRIGKGERDKPSQKKNNHSQVFQ